MRNCSCEIVSCIWEIFYFLKKFHRFFSRNYRLTSFFFEDVSFDRLTIRKYFWGTNNVLSGIRFAENHFRRDIMRITYCHWYVRPQIMQRLPALQIPHISLMMDLISKIFDVLFIVELDVSLRGSKRKIMFEVVIRNSLRNIIFGMHFSILTVMSIK